MSVSQGLLPRTEAGNHETTAVARTLLALVAFCSVTTQAAFAQSEHCDAAITVRDKQPGAYQLRGDRCEGVYEQKVAGGTGLLIASLTASALPLEIRPEDKMHLEWTAPVGAGVRIRALSLRYHHYYRMDTLRPAGSSAYVWPADILGKQKLNGKEVGVVGFARHEFQGSTRDILVPVRVSETAGALSSKTYTLVVVPQTNLTKVYLSLWMLNADGGRGEAILRGQDLKLGIYPARRGIPVTLPALPESGYYSIELGAISEDGRPASVELTLYHAGAREKGR